MNRSITSETPEIREIIASYNILLEYFEQIKAYNEIGYQTIHLGIYAAIENIKQNKNQYAFDSAFEKLNRAMEKSKNASSKIEQLSTSGTKLLKRLKEI